MRVSPSLMRLLSAALLALGSFGSAMAAVYNVRNYGATGDGRTHDTHAIQAAIDAAGQAGGGEGFFPDGNYRSVRLTLGSNLVLNVSPGAVILASPASDDWSQLNLATLIYARKADHITLEGGGTLDGGGVAYYDPVGNFAPGNLEIENRQTYLPHDTIGTVYNITFSNITCRASARASQINDQPPGHFRNLTFHNLEIHDRETYDGNSGPLHLAGGYPDAQKYGRMPAHGLFARDVDGLNFIGRIVFHDDGQSHRPAFASENVSITGTPPL